MQATSRCAALTRGDETPPCWDNIGRLQKYQFHVSNDILKLPMQQQHFWIGRARIGKLTRLYCGKPDDKIPLSALLGRLLSYNI
jgi:hypothetical protein